MHAAATASSGVKKQKRAGIAKSRSDPGDDHTGTRVANQTDHGAQRRKAVSWDHGKFAARAFGSDACSVKEIYDKSIKACSAGNIPCNVEKSVCRVRSVRLSRRMSLNLSANA